MTRPNSTAFLVIDDLDAARDFYGGVLGCKEASRGDGFSLFRFASHFQLFVAAPGAHTGVYEQPTTGAVVMLPVPDAAAIRAVLARRLPDLPPLVEDAWGRRLALTDPGGHAIWLVEPPAA